MSSPTLRTRAMLRKIQSFNKNRVFRVAVIGQKGVGKSALTVRFLTRRFIGDYDSTLEKTYTYTRCILGSSVDFEILDTAGQYENSKLKQHIKWSDAVVLMYSVTDRCSFNEARRLHFTINASCRRRYKPASDPSQEFPQLPSTPVTLVANQKDREPDRMVSSQEGAALAAELGCLAFTELSVREDIEQVLEVFEDLFLSTHRKTNKSKGSGPVHWSLASLERLAFSIGRGEKETTGGKGEEGTEGGSEDAVSTPPSPALHARRREALVS